MDEYYTPYDEEYSDSQGTIHRLYSAGQMVTSRVLYGTTNLLLMPFIGVKNTIQWLFFLVDGDLSDDQYWFCSKNGCQGIQLVIITLFLSCCGFCVILYYILVKKEKSARQYASRTNMVTTSTQVDDYIQPTLDAISTRQLSESRIDSITDDNTSHNVRLFSNIGDTTCTPPTKAYRRTISFSQDVDIKPANKKRRIPVIDKPGQASPRKSSMSASSLSISTRNKQSSSFSNFKKRFTAPHKSPARISVSKISHLNKSTEGAKSPFNNVGPRKSKTRLPKTTRQNSTLKSNKSKSGPLFQSDQKSNKFVFSRMNSSILSPKKTNSSNRNKTFQSQSLSASSKSEGWFSNKRSHEMNIKLLKKKPNREKSFYSSKFNDDAYLIDHDRPRGIGTNSLFSNTQARSSVFYPNHVIRPHATRELDKPSHNEFHPPRKTETPEIKSFKGQGAFTPMFKDQFEKNASWCNNSKQFHPSENGYDDSGMKYFKSDKLMFNNAISKNNIEVKSIREIGNLRHFTSTNLNSLRSTRLNKVAHQNKTDNSSCRSKVSEDLKQAFTFTGCKYGTKTQKTFKLADVQGARKENLNFMLSSSRPKTYNRTWKQRGVSTGHRGVKGVAKSDLSSSSSSRSRGSKSNRRKSDQLSTVCIRHALESGLVKTRHPFKPTHRTATQRSKKISSRQRIKSLYEKPAKYNDQNNRKTEYDNKNTSDEQNSGSETLFPRISCKCDTIYSKLSSSNDDTKSDTCRFCARVSRPLTSHRHRPYNMRTSRCVKFPKSLDKNNCSPSKNGHFFLATKEEDVTSIDSDCPRELDVLLNAGTDSRHVFIPGLTKHKVTYTCCSSNTGLQRCDKPKASRTKKNNSKDMNSQLFASSKIDDHQKLGLNRIDTNAFCSKGNDFPELEFSGSYTDYLKFCRAKRKFIANSLKVSGSNDNVDELTNQFAGVTKNLFEGENTSYSNFLKQCNELKNPHRNPLVDVRRCNSENKKSDKVSLKSVHVQTSPKLEASKSGLSKTKSSISYSSYPKYVSYKLNRPKRFRPRYHKFKSTAKKINNKQSDFQVKNKDTPRTNGKEKEAEDIDSADACNTYSEDNQRQKDHCQFSNDDFRTLLHRENDKYMKKTTSNLNSNLDESCDHEDNRVKRENKVSDDYQCRSDETLSSLNETYIIEEEVSDFKRPTASPRKLASPQLPQRFMQRPMWQNADVNELDRRVQRALKLREELQLRKNNKDNTPTTMHLIQQIEEGLKKGDTADTCTEDLRPSDTDEIPSCQLDTTLNFDENLSLRKPENTSIFSEKNFRAENNYSRSTTTTVVLNGRTSSEQSWQDNSKNNELLDKVLFGDSTEMTKSNQRDFSFGKSNEAEQFDKSFTDKNVEKADSALCLDILSDELNKLQKREARRCSLNVTSRQSFNSINTISMLTDSDIVTKDNSKNNTPPIKICKFDNETTKNSLRLIGELVDSLPKVPTKSMVDWFLATSDPRDFDSISKSGLSSNSSENENVRNEPFNAPVQVTNCTSKQTPFPKCRLKSSYKDMIVPKPFTNRLPPSQTKESTKNPPERDGDKLNHSLPTEKETGKRAPSKRFPRTRERKILAKSDLLTKVRDSDKPPHAKKEIFKESVATYSYQTLDIARNHLPQPHVFGSKTKKRDEVGLQVPSRPNSSGQRSVYARSVSRQRTVDRKPVRAHSQPPNLSTAQSDSQAEPPDEEGSPLGVQQIIMKFRQRHEAMSPTDSQPDKYRIRIKKKSDVKGIIAKFSNR